jgi:hypothetical protein
LVQIHLRGEECVYTYNRYPNLARNINNLLVYNLVHPLNGTKFANGPPAAGYIFYSLGGVTGYWPSVFNVGEWLNLPKQKLVNLPERYSRDNYTAQVVISNADPVITLGKLVNPTIVSSKIRKKVERLRPSLGAFYAFIGTDLDLPSLGITDANIHHYDDFDVNRSYEVMTASSLQEAVPSYFIASPSVKDPEGGHAPPGRHIVEIVTEVSYSVFEKWRDAPSMKRGEEYAALKDKP